MASDISRSTFNPAKRYSGVRQQQGRVNLDADWNEQADIAAHRSRLGTVDLVGGSGAPRDNAGFGVSAPVAGGFAANDLVLSGGRMYVDGLMCELPASPVPIENFIGDGTATAGTQVQLATVTPDGLALAIGQWVQLSAAGDADGDAPPQPQLAQITAVNVAARSVTFATQVGVFGSPNTGPTLQRVTTYLTQPDLPTPPPLPNGGKAIVYLDVWERSITALEDPLLLEIALGGPDTTTRTKTVWQVKWVAVPNAVSCSTPDTSIAAWQTAIQPSAGLLTNGIVPSNTAGPCSIAANAGYSGMENQYYRIEIHQGGSPLASGPATYPLPVGAASFKWSRDNATVTTAVSGILSTSSSAGISTSQLTVQTTGRDAVLSFSPNDWVEITDDLLELSGRPGELHQIDSAGVDQTRSTIRLQTPLSADLASRIAVPADTHVRMTRWDQGGKVFLAGTDTLWVDLNGPGSTGDIPLPPSGTSLTLENGITVAFDLGSTSGLFNALDTWNFAARTADGSVEPLLLAPPSAIHHRYARLGTISFDASPWAITDCRQIFAPAADPGIHITAVSLTGTGQALLNDSSITVQQLAGGISVSCDGVLDPATVTQTNSVQATSGASQATCFLSVGLPIVSGPAIIGFQPLILGATVALDTTQTNIQWTPTENSIAGLTAQMTTLANATSTTEPPTVPTVLAHMTLKGNSIWALANPDIYLDGETFGTPYLDQNGVQRTGLTLPSGDGHRGGDFSMWFWLNSQPALTISPTSLTFADTLVQQTSGPLSITLSNTTGAEIPFTLAVPGSFAATDTCAENVPANSTCTINVTFTPQAAGPISGQLVLSGGADTFNVPLSGNGLSFQLSVSPTSLAFGVVRVNTTSAPQTVTLTNSGTGTIVIASVTNASANFSLTTTCTTLAQGASCVVTVQFTPQSTGALFDSITIISPQASVTQISLSGTSTQPKNELKDFNDSKTFRDKSLRDNKRFIFDGPVVIHQGTPVIVHGAGPVNVHEATPAIAGPMEAADARTFIQPEERPEVGKQVLETPQEEPQTGSQDLKNE